MKENVESVIKEHEQQVQEVALSMLREEGIVHLDPTYDRTFKWLMSNNNEEIAKVAFDSVMFLAYKGLETRKVVGFQSMSENFDKMTEQLKHQPDSQFQALTMDIPVELDLRGNRGGPSLSLQRSTKVWMDIEMQRAKQDKIEARTLQYGAIALLSQKAEELFPLLLVSICQWPSKSGEIVNDVFHAVFDKYGNHSVPISQITVNVQNIENPIGMDEDGRKAERKRVSDLFKESLKRRYPELTNGIRSFKELWTLEDDLSDKRRSLRTAYEFLKFLRLAPLMPELPYEGIEDKKVKRNEKKSFQSETRVFNQAIRRAYNIMSTRYVNDNNIPGAQEQYRGVWDVTQTKEELTQT
ncbi:MAG: hypothetical protein LBF94_04335, partial [Puniceicoccales bacterium]|nr:hypothetical protein [Puniceicoccales bacterium]